MTRNDARRVASAARWRQACGSISVADGGREYKRVLRAWSAFGRHYHTVEHLAACLQELDRARTLAQHPAEVELALWFHDAVYRTYRHDNELRSAEWAARFLTSQRASAGAVSRVRQLVLATAHVPDALTGDAALVVDIDLSILGRPPQVYDQFENNVRREYWWVPRRRYVAARRAILQSFLARSAIYHWPQFQELYEATARVNLERAIHALSHA